MSCFILAQHPLLMPSLSHTHTHTHLVRKTTSVDRIIELTGLDHKCIREAKGRKLLEDERRKVGHPGSHSQTQGGPSRVSFLLFTTPGHVQYQISEQ